MLPKFLLGSFKRYKADTDRFTTWLAETGTKCGHRLKLEQKTDDGAYKIPLKEFTDIAKTIAGSTTTVPSHIVEIARRAISLRKRCYAWFSRVTTLDDTKNIGHSYFIQVLEEVLELLGVRGGEKGDPVQKKDRSSSGNGTPVVGLENRFRSLNVEEHADTSSSSLPTRSSKKHAVTRYKADGQFENEEWAKIFASFCLFEDLSRIRDFLQTTWVEYRSAHIDLMAAAVTTNMAFDLVRQACDDFMKIHPSLSGNMVLPQTMYNTACILRGESPATKHHPEDPFNIAVADVAEWCLFPTVQLLEAFTRVVEPGNVPRFKKDYFGKTDLTKARGDMTVRERYHQDRNILLSLLPNFVFFTEFKVRLPTEDEFTRGVKDMVNTKHVPVWLAFAAQVLLDIHHVLGPNVVQPFQELRLTGLRTKKTLDEALSLAETVPIPRYAEQLKQLRDVIDRSITYDIMGMALGVPDMDEFALFKGHPVLCGLLMFSINLKMQEIGIALVNGFGAVIHLAYLYNLIQQEGRRSLCWPDMDKIIEFHDEKYIFMGGKPKDLNETYKKLCLMLGFAPESFATHGRRQLKNTKSKKGPRSLKSTTVVSSLFMDRYCRDGSIDLSVSNVSQLLEDLDGATKEKGSSNSKDLMRRKWVASQTLGPIQLLAALRERLAAEEPRLVFNYFGMQNRCMNVLNEIKTELDDKFLQYFGSNYLENDTQLAYVVGLIFNVALGSAATARNLGLSKGGPQIGSRVVMRAGDVIQAFTNKKGSVGCKELRVFCKRKEGLLTENSKEEKEEKTEGYWFALDEFIDPKAAAAFELGIGYA